jgi:hypothetical protein
MKKILTALAIAAAAIVAVPEAAHALPGTKGSLPTASKGWERVVVGYRRVRRWVPDECGCGGFYRTVRVPIYEWVYTEDYCGC